MSDSLPGFGCADFPRASMGVCDSGESVSAVDTGSESAKAAGPDACAMGRQDNHTGDGASTGRRQVDGQKQPGLACLILTSRFIRGFGPRPACCLSSCAWMVGVGAAPGGGSLAGHPGANQQPTPPPPSGEQPATMPHALGGRVRGGRSGCVGEGRAGPAGRRPSPAPASLVTSPGRSGSSQPGPNAWREGIDPAIHDRPPTPAATLPEEPKPPRGSSGPSSLLPFPIRLLVNNPGVPGDTGRRAAGGQASRNSIAIRFLNPFRPAGPLPHCSGWMDGFNDVNSRRRRHERALGAAQPSAVNGEGGSDEGRRCPRYGCLGKRTAVLPCLI